jgi:hypothetical protein
MSSASLDPGSIPFPTKDGEQLPVSHSPNDKSHSQLGRNGYGKAPLNEAEDNVSVAHAIVPNMVLALFYGMIAKAKEANTHEAVGRESQTDERIVEAVAERKRRTWWN